MKIEVVRDVFGTTFTRGRMYVNGAFECFTLEDTDRKLESGGMKIPSETAIPRGTYKVIVTRSNRFARDLPLLVDVPQFSGVRIHSGNTSADTEGCILVGLQDATVESRVDTSRVTFEGLWQKIEAAHAADEDISIQVS